MSVCKGFNKDQATPLLSGFVYAYDSVAPGSNP